MNKTNTKSHFIWIDVARGLAALAVVFWHYQHFFYPLHLDVAQRSIQPFYALLRLPYNYGGMAVQFFWVISGFVFANVYLKKATSAYVFFVKRFSRLYPLHFLTLNLILILQLISFYSFGEYQIYKTNDLYHYVLNLFFASHWGLQKDFSFNAPIWSVSVEILIYSFFWLSLHFLRKVYFWFVALSIVTFLIAWKMETISTISECGFYFFSGCLTYYLWELVSKKAKSIFLLFFSIGIILLTSYFISPVIAISALKLIFFPLATLTLALFDSFNFVSANKIFTKLGDMTYSLYLLHIPIQIIMCLTFKFLGFDIAKAALNPFLLIFYTSACLISATLCFQYIEIPLKNYFYRKMVNR